MSEILIYLHSIRLFGIEDNGAIGISSYCGINIWQCKPNAMGNRMPTSSKGSYLLQGR